jgi:hypothetical protein
MTKNANPLRPTASLLVKLGSIAIHAEELLSPTGHPLDRVAMQTLYGDEEVKDWIAQMNAMAMLPVKR